MPADDPAAYQQMSTDEIVKGLEDELAKLDQSATEAGIDLSGAGAEQLAGEAVEADAEQALTEAEEVSPTGADAEDALTNVLSSGVTDPPQILDALRTMGFELVRVGSAPGEQIPEAVLEEAPPEEEMPFREARRKAAENAVGGTV